MRIHSMRMSDSDTRTDTYRIIQCYYRYNIIISSFMMHSHLVMVYRYTPQNLTIQIIVLSNTRHRVVRL